MAKNLLKKYVWLVETIYNAKRITFEEINEKWRNHEMSEGVELALRTFHTWRIAVGEIFGLSIECERKGGYHYYIQDADEIKQGSIRHWLLNTISVSNLLMAHQPLKERILLEEIPSGQAYLPVILEAMKISCTLGITYHSYGRKDSHTFEVEPYCLKLFKQRWYLVARSPSYDKVLIYALDRIRDMQVCADKKFTFPPSFLPSAFFEECYGVIAGDGTSLETVKLKVSAKQTPYLRSLPLHPSQCEVQTTQEYSLFELQIRPTFDFQQEILRHGEEVEVLKPTWLRKEMAGKIKRMWNKYDSK